LLIDLHLPVDAESDAESLNPLLDRAAAKGLNGLCLVGGPALGPTAALAEAVSREGLLLLPGARVVTDLGVLLVFFPEVTDAVASGDWLAAGAGAPAAQAAIDAAAGQGGVAVAAHPYARIEGVPRMSDHLLELDGLAAVEVRHGASGDLANDMALEATSLLGLPGVGGSGAPEALGQAATLIGRPVNGLAELIAAIREGEVWPAEVGPDLSSAERRPPRDRDSRGDRRPRRDGRAGGGGRGDRGRPDRKRGGGGRGRGGGGGHRRG